MASRPEALFRYVFFSHAERPRHLSATQSDHVIYESRLELARLLLADFDTSVAGIAAQPFLFVANVNGNQRTHIPDYMLITKDGPVVADVKRLRNLIKPVVVRTFA